MRRNEPMRKYSGNRSQEIRNLEVSSPPTDCLAENPLNQPTFKRFVAICLVSALMTSACGSGNSPTAPSESTSGTQPSPTVPAPTTRVISVDANSIEVQGASPQG